MQLGTITASARQSDHPQSAPRVVVREQPGFVDHRDNRSTAVPTSNQGGFISHDRQPPARRAAAAPGAAPAAAARDAAGGVPGCIVRHRGSGVWNMATQTSPCVLIGPWQSMGLGPAVSHPPGEDTQVLVPTQSLDAICAQLERCVRAHCLMLPINAYVCKPLGVWEEQVPPGTGVLFCGADAAEEGTPRPLVREIMRAAHRQDPTTMRWVFPEIGAWWGETAAARRFFEGCRAAARGPRRHWYEVFLGAHPAVAVDMECRVFQDASSRCDPLGHPLPGRCAVPVSAFLRQGADTDLEGLERQAIALHQSGVDDVVVCVCAPVVAAPLSRADFPWVRMVQLHSEFENGVVPLAMLQHRDTVLLLDEHTMVTPEVVRGLYQQFVQRPHCVHGIFGEEFYDRDLRPSRGTQADVVHGSCMLLAKSHLPAVQCVQEHHPPCKRMPADLVISRVAALASGGSRSAPAHRLHPGLAAALGPHRTPPPPSAERKAHWAELHRRGVRWAPFLQQHRAFVKSV